MIPLELDFVSHVLRGFSGRSGYCLSSLRMGRKSCYCFYWGVLGEDGNDLFIIIIIAVALAVLSLLVVVGLL